MKKKIIAIALALCMVTSLLPATVLAASEGEPQCTVTEGCTLSNGHEGECVLPEEGGEPDAPAACTNTEGCTLAEGHEGECVLPKENGEPVVTMLDGVNTPEELETALAPTATKTGVQEKNCTVCGYGVCATVPATGTSTPQTGDPFNVWLFVGLLCIGTTGLVVLTGVQLKKHRAGK